MNPTQIQEETSLKSPAISNEGILQYAQNVLTSLQYVAPEFIPHHPRILEMKQVLYNHGYTMEFHMLPKDDVRPDETRVGFTLETNDTALSRRLLDLEVDTSPTQ